MKRNLIYYIYPLKNGIFEDNIAYLKLYSKNLSIFNNKKIIVISQDNKTVDYNYVKELFSDDSIEYIITNNDFKCEGNGFKHLMKAAKSLDEDEITFYAHAKGVTHPNEMYIPSICWAKTMYKKNMENIVLVENKLKTHWFCGCFLMKTNEFNAEKCFDTTYKWHYQGSFFWFNNNKIFQKYDEKTIDPSQYFCAEIFPGTICDISKSYNLTSNSNINLESPCKFSIICYKTHGFKSTFEEYERLFNNHMFSKLK